MKRKAFTLIELLVVISIVVILLAVSLPLVRSMTRGNSEKQTVNLLTSMMGNARSIAIQTHRIAGIVIYDDPQSAGSSMVATVYQTGLYTPSSPIFSTYPHTSPQRVPNGVIVQTMFDGQTNSYHARAVMFQPNGQLAIVSPLTTADLHITMWGFAPVGFVPVYDSSTDVDGDGLPDTVAIEPGPTSSGSIMVFNQEEYQSQTFTDDAAKSAWMQSHGDILVVNQYTGSVLK